MAVKKGEISGFKRKPGKRPLYDDEINRAISSGGYISGCDKTKAHTIYCRAKEMGYRAEIFDAKTPGKLNIRFKKI